MRTFNLKSITLVLSLLSASLQVWALTNTPQVRGFMNNWNCTEMTQSSNNSNIYYYEATSNGEFKVTDGCNWDNDKNLSYYDNSKGNVTLSGNNTGGNLSCSQAGTWYICFDSSDSKVYATTTNPDAGGGGGGSLDADLIAVLNGTKIMVYCGELSSWNQSTYKFKNNSGTAIAEVSLSSSITVVDDLYKIGYTTLAPNTTYYNQGHWDSGLSCQVEAGYLYVVRGSKSSTYFTQKASSGSNYLYRVSQQNSSTSATRTASTTISSSITQGSSISVSTSTSAGKSVVGRTNTIKYYLYDGSDWSELTVSAGSADVSSLAVGTGYKIVTVLYDGYIYVNADEDTFSVTAATVPTITFSSTSGTINWGDAINITVSTANIVNNSTITFKAGSTTIGTASVSSNSATLNYQPTAFASSTTITAEYSSTTSTNSYTLSMNTPSVSLSASPTSNVGTGDNVTFTATKSNVSTNATVTYKFEDTTSGTSTIQAASSTNTCTTSWSSSGSKTVKVTMTITFSGSSKTATATKSVTISPKTTIYFDNSITNWSKVYLYLYSQNYYESNGSGSQSNKGCYAECLQMSLVAGASTIYSYTYLGTVPSYVCFLNASQSNYGNFWDGTEGAVRGAYKSFSASTPLYIPTSTYETKNNVYYYNSGSWSEYPPTSYTLTVNISPSGAGSITAPSGGTATVTKYSTTTITATKNNGYTFTGWTKTGTATIANANNLSTTVTNVQSDATITANFTQDQYSVTYNSNGGTGTQTDASTYTYGSTVTVKPQGSVARTGYTFGGWNTNSSGTGTNYTAGTGTFTITGNTTLYAKWTENKHNVTISYKCGSTTIKDNTTQSNVGEVNATSITAATINGYTFSSWTVGTGVQITSGSTSTKTISIKTKASGNYTLTANYTQDNYTVTVNSVGGEISAPAGGSYTNKHYDDEVTITAVNPDALTFVGWTASPAANATIADATLLSTTATIKGNVTLTATFRMPITVYFSNEQCWDEVKIHAWGAVGGTVESTFPGNAMTQNSDGWWTYTFDKSITQVNFLFANSSGTYQSNDCSNVTTTTYYKMSSTTAGQRGIETTTSSYEPSRCTPDVYTVVGDEALVGSSWDTYDGTNEMIWNSTNNRYELRKVNVSLAAGYKYYRFVKNHCYLGSGCGQWPAEGQSNANYNFTSAKSYDLVFWLKPSSDFSHPGLDDTYGLEVYDAATYFINHPWGDGNGSWTKKEMTYSGSGNTYLASGVFGGAGADIYNGETKLRYYENNNSAISGYNNVTAGDNVVFTYDASAQTLSVACPTCVQITKYWICVPTTSGSTMPEQATLMTYNSDDGLYYTDPDTQPFLWPSNGAKVNANNNCSDNWIDRNNIVNWDKMTTGQLVQYIYDPDINQLTVVDGTLPQITLTATQAVNAAATQSVITLTTTSSRPITNATYSYKQLSGPSGSLAASTTSTTTFTTTNEGVYNFQVTVSCDEGTFTATCTVKVKFKITIYANVEAPNWSGTINLYYWATGVTGANYAMTSVGGKWYKYEVKGVPEFSFIVRQGTSSGSYQTIDIGPIDDDICIVVSSNIQSGGSSRLYSVTTDCELYMRFASTYTQMKGSQNTGETKTVYSNLFKQDGDEVSFYVGTTPQVKFQTFNSTNNAWNAGTAVSTGVSGGDVYAGEYLSSASNKLKNFSVYTDDYFIRTDAAPGAWNDYIRSDQDMFQFSENAFFPNEWYNHYWCHWTGDGTNVKACVGNRINPSLTDTLPDFYLTMGTNMRFEYDNRTNYIGRQFLKGSSGDFLKIYASNTDAENFIYKFDDATTRIKKDNSQTFNDGSDWVYLIDVKAKPNGSDDVKCYVYGRYPVNAAGIGTASDQDNNLGGYDTDGTTPLPITIMGGTTTADTYNMRLIYDYKTNRLMAVWYPAGQELTAEEDITVDANFMMSRTDDNAPLTVAIKNSNVKVLEINQMVSTLTITKSEYNSKKKNGVYFYWISLPYNCRVKDIYGIGSYGKKWTVQRYRGDMRALYGFRHDITTFWANMKQNATATMEANRGYVIRVQLTNDDFKEINGTSQVTLYFPSCNTSPIQLNNSSTSLQTIAPEMICNVVEPVSGKSRRNFDSNWNIIGNPGMGTMKITSPTALPSGDPNAQAEDAGDKTLNYYYKWTYNSTSSTNNYAVQTVANQNIFQPMYSYMVQYGGTVTWQPQIETIDPSLLRRRNIDHEQQDILISVLLKANEYSESSDEQVDDVIYDRTYITLHEGAKTEFTLNQDITKMGNNAPMIYSVFDDVETAGKQLPHETTIVPLTVNIPKMENYINGELQEQPTQFSIGLEDQVEKTITLIDYVEGKEVVLNQTDYPISLTEGVYNDRFALRITEKQDVVTANGDAQSGDGVRVITDGKMLYVDGITEPTELSIYDVTGRNLLHTIVSEGVGFAAPQTGVYLIQIGGKVEKIVLR
ncbi:MAG: InlB B-repeat-containing protein [Paludibacteraceae bacterium]|nr:InlB B-repeat-containing protein [Paludibacteraceae bacterium]